MALGSMTQLFPLALLSLSLAVTRSETAAVSAPTVPNDNLETSSGGGEYYITTKGPFHDLTENVFTFEYDDTTHSQPVDGEGALGPGAIAAIAIAVVLGASVFIALIVITLKKFTAA